MTAAGEGDSDLVREYADDLAAALRGPARAKARMVEELCGGLLDTTDAHADRGLSRRHAFRAAVRESGTVDELVPGCQREPTLAQARHTARSVALTAPVLIARWCLAGAHGPASSGPVSRAAQLLAVNAAVVAVVAALLAAATLAATGGLARRLPAPRRLPLLVAWTGTTAGIAMAVTTLALATAAALAEDRPLLACAGVLAAASHAVVATSARACRRCARQSAPKSRTVPAH
ncbi:permease prefix domain 1-containing protein [Streptomyces sp. MSC1_001]|jgi:hypothetical protein|uniref:permease prefix domain 1-containing protein n=1 Tax=Streptomyces sp. MSC1_001 TaxID=2909263 RepID=UPI002030664F|nr:permease prefix domain 1-containing protein [Streptomyces sp. MSC1_001]